MKYISTLMNKLRIFRMADFMIKSDILNVENQVDDMHVHFR